MVATFPALVLSAAAEAFALTLAIPEHLPPNPFVWTLIRTFALNVVLFGFYKVAIYPFLIDPLRHLPHPSNGRFLLGNGMSQFQRPPAQDLLTWVSTVPNEGLIYFRGMFYQPRLLVSGPKAIGELLVTKSYDFEKPAPVRNFLRKVLGNGLIIVEGDEHRFQRKNIMPVFQFRHIKELYPMMYKKALRMNDAVDHDRREHPSPEDKLAGDVEINAWANKVTMDIIGLAGLGREFNTLKNTDDELVINYEELLEPSVEKVIFFAARVIGPEWLIARLPWKLNERFRIMTSNLTRITQDLVVKKKQAIKTGGESTEHLDILSVLIRSNNFSDKELADQMLTFLAAGHETTSSAFTWTTYLLALHPDIQTRLRDEIISNLPSDPSDIADLASLLESLPVLNAVANETLRLYPTVPITTRISTRDTSLMGQFVPKNTQIVVSPWAVNRSPDLWGPDAGQFVPDRWINLDGKPNNTGGAQSAYSTLTFLHGPRSCIGANFAKAELRCLLAAFVRKFEIALVRPDEEVVPGGVVTSKPKNGMHLRLTLVEEEGR